uniref:Uncharacterized protein n=1 Tax=Anopheles coluzzii TaxID=1518534 RepID=A0A8W7PNR4_ANOCL
MTPLRFPSKDTAAEEQFPEDKESRRRASTVATTCTARAAPRASVATGATVNVQPVAIAVGGAGIGHLAESGRTVQGSHDIGLSFATTTRTTPAYPFHPATETVYGADTTTSATDRKTWFGTRVVCSTPRALDGEQIIYQNSPTLGLGRAGGQRMEACNGAKLCAPQHGEPKCADGCDRQCCSEWRLSWQLGSETVLLRRCLTLARETRRPKRRAGRASSG